MTVIMTGTRDECEDMLEIVKNDPTCPYDKFEVSVNVFYPMGDDFALCGWVPMTYDGPLPTTYTPPQN